MKTLIVGSGNEISSELVKSIIHGLIMLLLQMVLMHLKRPTLFLDLLIGDFDSLPANLLKEARQSKD